MERLGSVTEMYLHELSLKPSSYNVYLYLRSKQGYGNECTLFAFPLNYRASVAYALSFAEVWMKLRPNWQGKDLIILFYEETDYALSVKSFLENYYHPDLKMHGSIREDSFETRVEGRCGYIRQAYAFNIQESDFNKFSIFLDGKNSQLPDIDFFDVTADAFPINNLKYDLG